MQDEKTLIWYCGREEFQLSLSSVTRIVPGQRTANFQRHPQPDKEYQSFSLIFGNEEQSLDLVCKDKEQAELWFIGLKALISGDGQPHRTRLDRKNGPSFLLDTSSPVGYLRRTHTIGSDLIQQQDNSGTQWRHNISGSSPNSDLYKNISSITTSTTELQKNYQLNSLLGSSLHSNDLEVGSENCKDSVSEGFRVSLSSVISSSSQGSAQDESETLGDVYIWGEGAGDGLLGGGMRVGATGGFNVDALLPKHLESAVMLDAQNIACGNRHAALVNRQGDLFCWGEESGGRLGHGINADVPQPRLVDTLAHSNAEFVACGHNHTCVITVTGDLYTWGNGSQSIGLLGHGNDVSHWVPRRVTLPEGVQVATVACGPWHTAFITLAGQLFTFGDGTFGVLGHGDKANQAYPKEVESLKGLKTIKVACGIWHSAAVVEVIMGASAGSTCASGKLFTWGDGDKGCLGQGAKETRLLPTCVSSLVDYDFRQVACGHNLTVALTTSGQVYTMGSSVFGQLGDPLAKGQTPGLVEGKLWEAFVEEIACGAHHVVVLTSKTDVYTWGKGSNGQLGHGDVQNRNTPTKVEAFKGKQVKSIACGSNCTAAICLHKMFTGADQSICSACRTPFMFTRKRHNCYNCGHAFCHTCSNKKILRAKLAPNPKKAYRVCDACYVKIRTTECGTLSQTKTATGVSMAHSLMNKDKKNKPEVRSNIKQLFTPRLPLFEQQQSLEGVPFGRQNKKHESLRRVSPTPSDFVSWGHYGTHNEGDFSRALVKASTQPTSRSIKSLNSESPSLSQSTIFEPRYDASGCKDVTVNDLRETNKALREDLSRLGDQLEKLKQQFLLQEEKLQLATKEMEVGKMVAEKETAKSRVAKEVIKSLTLQLKALAPKVADKLHIQNGSNTLTVCQPEDQGACRALPASSGGSMSEIGLEVSKPYKDWRDIFSNNCDMEGERSIPPTPSRSQHTARPYFPSRKQSGCHFRVTTSVSTPADTHAEREWVEQDEPGVYITFVSSPGGSKDLRRVRFSRKKFTESQAELWWTENKLRVYQQHNMLWNSSSLRVPHEFKSP
ncbi:hypothetical protein GOP47_0001419 [Adiantum capillus-veneris]|uniref:Uncharacterized protein n=1 Tax=Adiantum capillus-veneris TaxID=13818 RepID=A0A9D4V880_ADICA|nr:hypothetical protein GOP47_0001419 [Adiantum capillus-veneris]